MFLLYNITCDYSRVNKSQVKILFLGCPNQKLLTLKEKSDLTEEMKNSDPLYWVGTMNAIKGQAEEIVYNEIIYK